MRATLALNGLTIRREFLTIPRAKFLESDGLFRFISTCKFGSFKNHLATITSLSELNFRFRRLILLVQKKMIAMNYGSIIWWKSWRWVKFDLILMMRNVDINSNLNSLTKFTSSSRSTEFKGIRHSVRHWVK